MKREDFVLEMALFLTECIDRDKFSYQETCDALLDYQEVCGMLPPNDGKKRYIKRESVPCVINALKCHQWEE